MYKAKKGSNIKFYMFIIVVITAFITFLILSNRSFYYIMEYEVNGASVTEKYDNNNKIYIFNIKYKDIDIDIISIDKYTKSRHLVKGINYVNSDDSTCLVFDSKVSLYPICHNSDGYFSYYIDKEADFKENDTYENVKIDDLNNHNYFLWNYNGLIYLNKDSTAKIGVFNKDTYKLNLFYQYNNYLLLPDYNQEWMFDKIYVFNFNNAVWKEMSLRFPIYFDSYFLGNDGDNVYIFDRKEEQEYVLDIKKMDMYKSNNKILNNGNWENVSLQKLKNKEAYFKSNNIFNYYLDDGILYFINDIKVSNRVIDTIVKVDNLDVYYISKGILYVFNPNIGEKAILKYSEWEFNYQNMIFVN